ncbi:MAG: hypothetical protein ABIF77_09245, partial [bacterium]
MPPKIFRTVCLLLLLGSSVHGNPAPDSLLIEAPLSMGLPDRSLVTWGPVSGYDFLREEVTSRIYFDVTKKGPMGNFGVGDITFEIAGGHSGDRFDGALGAYLKMPWLRAGGEYSHRDKRWVWGLSAQIALARGGLLQRGDELRIEYRPQYGELLLGFTFARPFRRYYMTRPRSDHAKLPDGDIPKAPRQFKGQVLPDELAESLARIEQAIDWMDRLLTPHFETGNDFGQSASGYREFIRQPGRGFHEEDAAYHRELRRAFALIAASDSASPTGAAAADLGEQLATLAEQVIYRDILLPFNRFFGQNKSPHHLGGLATSALASFADSPVITALSPEQQPLVRELFRRVVARIDRVARAARSRWQQPILFWLKQSRLVWLPLNYGLRPEQYDSQAEWDRILADLADQEFSAANTISYLCNEQFHHELKRMILETETYQVLMIHDFRGQYGDGETDRIGWDLIVEGYLTAFQHAVAAIDDGRRRSVPQFHVFFDENYFQANRSRPVMRFLENIYTAGIPALKDTTVTWQVRSALARLREAVAASPILGGLPPAR